MSIAILDQAMISPVVLPMLGLESNNLSLLINAPGVHYTLEAPLIGSPIIEDNKITARFAVDDDVYLDLNLTGKSIEQENKFEVGEFSLFYHIEERRPRAHFVADTLMAVLGLAGRLDLKISEPEVSTTLNFNLSLLEISKMLHRRQTAYRLMVIEQATGTEFLLPSAISDKEIDKVSFIFHAVVDSSFTWVDGSLTASIPATRDYASLFTPDIQLGGLTWEVVISETVFGQPVALGPAVVTIEDPVVKSRDDVREGLEAMDGGQVALEIISLSGRVKYEFKEPPSNLGPPREPIIQALIDIEPYLDAAVTERYHALAASTLEGLTEAEKVAITARPELDEQAF